MALTLADVSNLIKDPLTKGFMDIFLEERELAQYIPVTGVDTMKARLARTVALPTPTWRALGNNHTESKGSWDYIEEGVFSAGNFIEVDWLIGRDKSLVKDPRQSQVEMFAKALAYEFNDVLINGDPVVNPDAPKGINARLADLNQSTQIIDGGSVAGASVLDVSSGTNRDSNGLALIDALDYLIDACDGHKADFILCNLKFLQACRSVLMRKGLWAANKDQFGRDIPEYRGAKLIDVSYKRDQSTQIIPNDFDGSGNTAVFAIRTGDEYLHMLEYLPLQVDDIGKVPGTKNLRTEVEWVWGLMASHPRWASKLTKVKVA